jgi:chromosomal replication initiator protein
MIFVSDIKAAVCRHYKLAAIEMVSHRRAAEVSHPRQVAMTLSKQMTVHSFPAIGKLFGRDHTTVMHAVKAVEQRYIDDPEVRNAVDSLSVGLLLRDTRG